MNVGHSVRVVETEMENYSLAGAFVGFLAAVAGAVGLLVEVAVVAVIVAGFLAASAVPIAAPFAADQELDFAVAVPFAAMSGQELDSAAVRIAALAEILLEYEY